MRTRHAYETQVKQELYCTCYVYIHRRKRHMNKRLIITPEMKNKQETLRLQVWSLFRAGINNETLDSPLRRVYEGVFTFLSSIENVVINE